MQLASRAFCILVLWLAPTSLVLAQAQQSQQGTPPLRRPPRFSQRGAATPLADLLKEAEANNPQIRGARQAWDAAKLIPTQTTVLPDPEFQVQHVSVGSPRPFAGYTNSEFAYIGLGVSQEFPYPGKRSLRSSIATSDIEIARQHYEDVHRSVLGSLKESYIQLSYIFESLQNLDADGDLLARLEEAADLRYRSGAGTQQDVLRAQLEETRYLAEISHHDLEAAKIQYRIKELLARSPSFSDVTPEAITESPLEQDYFDLLSAARAESPLIASAEAMVKKQQLQVEMARKDFYPDFSLQYMWQRTDPTQFRAYYMLSFGVRVPIYKTRKQEPAVSQAETELLRSRSEVDSQSLAVASELGNQYATAQRTQDLLRIYREGLLPQARTLAESGLAAYQNNRLNFSEVLAASLEISRLNTEYWQILADHESAVARIEDITGLSLRLPAQAGLGQSSLAATP